MKNVLFCFLVFISIHAIAQQGSLLTEPGKFGLSKQGLTRIDALMQKYVDEKKLPGMITMIARMGQIVSFQKYGNMDEGRQMQKDAIFRIASMTKPVTSVAIMILCDEGLLHLDDPVFKYIPEFKDLKVFCSDRSNSFHLEKQNKPMTIRNLLTHTSGLGSGAENSYVDSLYRVANMNEGTLKEEVLKLSKIPLKFQPGTRWQYGFSTDVLGYLIEVVSGETLDVFFKKRIFNPLKMVDTDYSVPKDKLHRVAAVYGLSNNGMNVLNIPEINNVSPQEKNIRGNGGLLSTASDYMIFCQMLLNKGEYKGVRILKRESVALMTSNHLTTELMPNDPFLSKLMQGMGYGLGLAVVKDKDPSGSPGAYWWAGSANTYFYIDPSKDLVLIFMTQFIPNYYYPVCKEFRELVYQSIIN